MPTAAGVSIPVTLTTFIGQNLSGSPIPVFETFVGVTSSGAATTIGGLDIQPFSGTVEFTALPGGAGANYLTAVFSNSVVGSNVLIGVDGGTRRR